MDDLVKFLKSLLNPEEYAWAVSKEVRDQARTILTKLQEQGNASDS